MLQKEFSAGILSPSQSHYFHGELQSFPFSVSLTVNHSEMRLPHELAGNIPSHPAQLSIRSHFRVAKLVL